MSKTRDMEIVDVLAEKMGVAPKNAEYNGLGNLIYLDLSDLGLTQLPPEIGQLTKLQGLWLENNRLRELPKELGQLTSLHMLELRNNPNLVTPPPEIVEQGTTEILTFLQGLQGSNVPRYEAKLLLVGEGGTGKSSLLRALHKQPFDAQLSTTHGIEVGSLKLLHPHLPKQDITLNTWDFGGQQIYHATHQFFLTKRSLYLVVWNTRLGQDQSNLKYWLDTIQTLAPDSPVVLVATHSDERTPDLNYQLYKNAYPQIVDYMVISNKSRAGLSELKDKLADLAAELPLVGQLWPTKWIAVEQSLLARQEYHIQVNTYMECCTRDGVRADVAQGTLGAYLHDLGKILYFRDDDILCNMVVLKPNWVTKAISHVLEDPATREARGILAHADLPHIWATDEDGQPYGRHLYPIFLRLMERFDLSYQIETDIPGEHPTHSLIPQLLPHEPPILLPSWPVTSVRDQVQLEMVYRFDFVPAGIMSWFIVRTHRYTRHLHWRDGVMLAYQDHDARVELNPMLRELRLLVRGVQPYNFFTILKNTLDMILARFEGLRVKREVPCICHWNSKETEPCKRFYNYEDLIHRMEARRYTVECLDSFRDVSVPELLYGIHISTDAKVMAEIRDRQEELRQLAIQQQRAMADVRMGQHEELLRLALFQQQAHQLSWEVNQLAEYMRRNFTRLWNLEMQKMETECPNTFFIVPRVQTLFNPKNWISQPYQLFLMCQHPPGPHCVEKGYNLRQSRTWWKAIKPWLRYLITFLKFGVPMGQAIGAIVDTVDVKNIDAQIGLLEKITESMPNNLEVDSTSSVEKHVHTGQEQMVGAALRALCSFLKEVDPSQYWGGLQRIVTPDGNILWLCEEHRRQFEVQPLKLGA